MGALIGYKRGQASPIRPEAKHHFILDNLVATDEAIFTPINDEYYRTILATQTMIKELIIGHLVGEGIRTSLE